MTGNPRAAFIREHRLLCGVLLYSVAFLAGALADDALRLMGASGTSRAAAYLLPLAVALPVWIGVHGWARRVSRSSGDDVATESRRDGHP